MRFTQARFCQTWSLGTISNFLVIISILGSPSFIGNVRYQHFFSCASHFNLNSSDIMYQDFMFHFSYLCPCNYCVVICRLNLQRTHTYCSKIRAFKCAQDTLTHMPILLVPLFLLFPNLIGFIYIPFLLVFISIHQCKL